VFGSHRVFVSPPSAANKLINSNLLACKRHSSNEQGIYLTLFCCKQNVPSRSFVSPYCLRRKPRIFHPSTPLSTNNISEKGACKSKRMYRVLKTNRKVYNGFIHTSDKQALSAATNYLHNTKWLGHVQTWEKCIAMRRTLEHLHRIRHGRETRIIIKLKDTWGVLIWRLTNSNGGHYEVLVP
jgi:hypothetical protein